MAATPQAVALALLPALSGALYSQPMPTKSTEVVHISGRIVDSKGRPRPFVVLSVAPLDPADSAPPLTAQAGYDGLVSFAAKLGKRYEFSIPGGMFKIIPPNVEADTKDEVAIGDIVVEPEVTSDFALQQIVVDSRATDHPITGPLPDFTPQCEDAAGSIRLERYKPLEDFIGKGAEAIRVNSLAGIPMRLPDGSAVSSTAISPEAIRAIVLQVWRGLFRSATCRVMWAESTWWGIGATVEYEDGSRADLLTDGGHVGVRDRKGRTWYIRLWPAVD